MRRIGRDVKMAEMSNMILFAFFGATLDLASR
jgi:uncharacterized membrane protein